MAATLNLGNGTWALKEGSLLAYNSENNNYKPLPFDFTRASSATRVNKQGLIETVASGVPRIDFTDANGALLLEPQRTNLALWSEDFTNVAWSKTNTSITTGSFVSPISGVFAQKLVEDTALSTHFTSQFPTAADGVVNEFIYAKKGERNWVAINIGGGANVYGYFDLLNGVVGSKAGGTETSIKDVGNGWYQCIISNSNYLAGGKRIAIYLAESDGVVSYTGDGISGVYIIGGQMNQTSITALSYIPTQGSAVTVVQDVCNNGGNDQVINSTEGVLYVEMSALANDLTNRLISLTDGSSDATNVSIMYSSTTQTIRAIVDIGYVLQTSLTYAVVSTSDISKVAFVYKENDFRLYVNGTLVASDTSGSVPSVGTLSDLSFNRINLVPFYGNVKDLQVFTTALTDAELIALTTI